MFKWKQYVEDPKGGWRSVAENVPIKAWNQSKRIKGTAISYS